MMQNLTDDSGCRIVEASSRVGYTLFIKIVESSLNNVLRIIEKDQENLKYPTTLQNSTKTTGKLLKTFNN